MRVFPNINDPWYQVIGRFELLRIFYNLLMLGAGLVSVSFSSVNIPIIYLAFALLLNIGYSCLPYVFLIFATRRNQLSSQRLFNVFLSLSIALVFLLALIVFIKLS